MANVYTMPERFGAIDRHYGNVILIFSEQLRIRFDIDLFKREALVTPGTRDCELRFIAQVTPGS